MIDITLSKNHYSRATICFRVYRDRSYYFGARCGGTTIHTFLKVKVLMVIVVVRKYLTSGNTFGNGSEEDIATH